MKNRTVLPRDSSTPLRFAQNDLVVFLFLCFCLLRSRRFRGSGRGRLQDQHAIAVTVETIPVMDRFIVRTKNEFASSERAHQH
jgi:hypothetical protein